MPFPGIFTDVPICQWKDQPFFHHSCIRPFSLKTALAQINMLVNLPLVVGERLLSAPLAASARCILAVGEMGPCNILQPYTRPPFKGSWIS